MSIRIILGTITILLSIVGYIPYLKDTIMGKTKPHSFSWLIWSILSGIAFVGQIAGGAGAGSWAMGMATAVCFIIALLGFRKGSLEITMLDWISCLTAIVAILLWIITKQPILSLILLIIIDICGYIPTFRKAYHHPFNETLITWFINGLKFAISLFALDKVTTLSTIYPVYLVVANWTLVGMILTRRRQVTAK